MESKWKTTMNLVKKIALLGLMILSLNAFSQDYVFPVLKSGVQADLENLISNPNNFVNETEYVFGNTIAYLKYTNSIANIFKKYGVVSSYPYDSNNISSEDDLISVGESFDTYYQCVQLVRALSNAGGTNNWQWSGTLLNKSMYLKWRIIAKFKSNGRYWQNGDPLPYGHVAIAIASNTNGVYVIDQNWEGDSSLYYGKVAIHLLPWSEASKYSLVTKPSNGLRV